MLLLMPLFYYMHKQYDFRPYTRALTWSTFAGTHCCLISETQAASREKSYVRSLPCRTGRCCSVPGCGWLGEEVEASSWRVLAAEHLVCTSMAASTCWPLNCLLVASWHSCLQRRMLWIHLRYLLNFALCSLQELRSGGGATAEGSLIH